MYLFLIVFTINCGDESFTETTVEGLVMNDQLVVMEEGGDAKFCGIGWESELPVRATSGASKAFDVDIKNNGRFCFTIPAGYVAWLASGDMLASIEVTQGDEVQSFEMDEFPYLRQR
jgi:hypothetical protein